MTGMALHIGWDEIALRLALTVMAGLAIGYNRTEHGKAAGLRTTLLVCLAASVAMIQVNLLLPTAGRASDSFVMNDLMRLPLGILTGVGFIGGGVILRHDVVVGVTTAATLWCVTVIGLCLGGGQIALGLATTGIGLVALWALEWIELRLRRERRASLGVEFEGGELNETMLRRMIEAAGMRITGVEMKVFPSGAHRKIVFDLLEFSRPLETKSPAICETLAGEKGVLALDWKRH
jgi:putative Mg2+ transporter-C (MgtC) family protein